MVTRPRARVALQTIPLAIKKLERRLSELDEIDVGRSVDWTNEAQRMITSINAAMDDVFGQGTADAHDFSISGNSFFL